MWKRRADATRSLLPGFLAWLISSPAIAQDAVNTPPPSDAPLSVAVERDDLAVSCPDLAWFKARIASHTGKAGQAGTFKITLTRQGEAWHARIERREQSLSLPAAERVLHDRSSACEPLAEAVAVTVAILADVSTQRAEQQPAASPEPQPAAPPEPQPSAIPPLPIVPVTLKGESSGSTQSGARVWLGAGGGAAISFVSPIAPVFGLGGAIDAGNLRAGVRLMVTPEQKFELDPGRVFVQAWLATIFSCLQLARGRLGAALCLAADASVLRASAEGFDQAKPSTRSYEAVGLEAHPSWYVSDGYRISAVLGSLLPFSRESFSVTGRGMAYVPPPINWRILLVLEIGVF